jgi:organic radical activating enzyme
MMKISGLYSGGVITNYHCSSRCGHCLYNCGPERSADYIPGFMTAKIFSSLKAQGCRSIHVGGGEPFLNFSGLLDFARIAQECGIAIEYIETNSSWYKDHDETVVKLEKLLDAGINCLLLSVSPFHNEYIPLRKFNGVLAACRTTGMQVFLWISEFYQELATLDADEKHSLQEYAQAFGSDAPGALMRRYSLTMRGRALETFRDQLRPQSYDDLCSTSGPCRNLTDTSHFHIDLYGNYIPGLCTGLAVALEDLGDELTVDKYPVLTTLYEHGIRGLTVWAEGQGWRPQKADYVSKCELCTEIRLYLSNRDFFPVELAPAEFYNEYS